MNDSRQVVCEPYVVPLSEWLIANGAPRFTKRYRALDNLRVLAGILFVVVAFELGMAPWLRLSGLQFALAPGAIAVLALLLRITWSLIRRRGRLRHVIVFYVLFFLVGAGAAWLGIPSAPVFWVDTGVILLLLHAFFRLAAIDPAVEPCSIERRRLLLGIVVGSVVLLGVEGSLLPPLTHVVSILGDTPAASLLTLAIASTVFLLSRPSAERRPGAPSPRPVDAFTGALPLLVLWLCVEAALLPYLTDEQWELSLSLAVLAGALLWSGVAQRLRRRSPAGRAGASTWALLFLPYLLAYPCTVALVTRGTTGLESQTGLAVRVWDGQALGGVRAGAFVLLVNVMYLLLAWALAALAVERIAAWVVAQAPTYGRQVFAGLAAHLPLILVFAAFSLLTAETWEVAVESQRGRAWEFWVLIGALVTLSWLLLALDGARMVASAATFDSRQELRQGLVNGRATGLTALPAEALTLLERHGHASDVPLKLRMTTRRWINALIIVAVYQLLIVIPLALLSATAFMAFAELAVPPGVAVTWIGGDEPAAGVERLVEQEGLRDPWLRVTVLLTAFALLERVVRILTEPEQHKSVFGPAWDGLRVRFAVALLQDWASRPTAAPYVVDLNGPAAVTGAPSPPAT